PPCCRSCTATSSLPTPARCSTSTTSTSAPATTARRGCTAISAPPPQAPCASVPAPTSAQTTFCGYRRHSTAEELVQLDADVEEGALAAQPAGHVAQVVGQPDLVAVARQAAGEHEVAHELAFGLPQAEPRMAAPPPQRLLEDAPHRVARH